MQKHFLLVTTCSLMLSPLFAQAIDLSKSASKSTLIDKSVVDVKPVDDNSEKPLPAPTIEVPISMDPQPPVTTPIESPPSQPFSSPPVPSTKTCSSQDIKVLEELRAETAKGASFEEVSAKFGSMNLDCLPSENMPEDKSRLSNLSTSGWWNTWFEQLDNCGYHPQRREFACTLRLKQHYGYGGPPPIPFPGSFEWVTVCVQMGTTMKLINIGQVHVHDNPNLQFGPFWHYGITLPDNPWLHTLPNTNGQTLKAQATLSWYTPALNCNSQPVWGNTIGFQIKLDP